MRLVARFFALAALGFGLVAVPRALVSRVSDTLDFVHFESSHVHPVAMTPNGNRLLVVNTPDNRLSVFDLTGAAPVRIAEIPVGMEPVSVAALDDGTAWVVNHLSDDVSVVDLGTMHVRATVRVGDEPSDVVFAGAGPKAYVSVSQEDAVRVFHTGTLARLATIPIPGRMPRALARNSDGSRVFAAVLHAGNRTSVLSEAEVTILTPTPHSAAPPPDPPLRAGLPAPPITSLIVQEQGGQWVDEGNQVWSSTANPTGQRKVFYSSLDTDVARISTTLDQVDQTFGDIGTVNFGLAVNGAGDVAVTATEARNLKRFEPNLKGHTVDTRAAVISAAGVVSTLNLNPTIDYSVSPGPASDLDIAIGIPTGIAWANNSTMVVTALANNRIARVSVTGSILARAPVVAGPTGVLVDDARGRIYVVGRFRNELQTLDQASLAPVANASIGMDPTPEAIVNGRKFFYGGFTSGHGDQACASCHVFGDFDNISWDLGNPQGDMQPINTAGQITPGIDASVHPMKGPMATQSLRGLPNTGMLHWRADRNDLDAFNPAFVGLMGRTAQLPDSEMAAFDAFTLPLVYPPNPNQFLNRTFRDAPLGQPSALRGAQFFFNQPTDGVLTCNNCHSATNRGPGTNGQIIPNQALAESQDMKVPHLRNMYKKTGFTDAPGAQNKRGFGFVHDGSVDNLFNFLQFPGFNFNQPSSQTPNANRRDVEAFLLAFDTGMAPAVGAQITFTSGAPPAAAVARMDTLVAQADSGFCDLVAKARSGGIHRGWQYLAGTWRPDRQAEAPLSSAALRALAGPGSELTVMGVPPGSGRRMGIERDGDNYLDADELDAGSDPGNRQSTPATVGVPGGAQDGVRTIRPNPFRSRTEVRFTLARPGPVECVVHDLLGRSVRSLARGVVLEAGPQSLTWDGRRDDGGETAAGVYFIRLSTDRNRWTGAVVKVK